MTPARRRQGRHREVLDVSDKVKCSEKCKQLREVKNVVRGKKHQRPRRKSKGQRKDQIAKESHCQLELDAKQFDQINQGIFELLSLFLRVVLQKTLETSRKT